MDSDVTVVDNPELRRFEIRADGEVAGFVQYRRTAAALSLTHTVIEPAFEGRGLGSALARGALDAARDRHVSVLPLCPFIREYIRRHPAYLDLVRSEQQARFSLTAGG